MGDPGLAMLTVLWSPDTTMSSFFVSILDAPEMSTPASRTVLAPARSAPLPPILGEPRQFAQASSPEIGGGGGVLVRFSGAMDLWTIELRAPTDFWTPGAV